MIGFTATLDFVEFLLVYFFVLIIYFINVIIRKNFNFIRLFHFFTWLFYWLSLIKVVFFPFSYRFKHNPEIFRKDLLYQFVPFHTVFNSIQHGLWIQIIGNIVLLLPIPILFVVLKRKKLPFNKNFLIGLILTISIELIQLLINYSTKYPNKVMDIDDVILNMIGILFGWIISKVYSEWYLNHKENSSQNYSL
ncbi:hypothetical protein CN692_01775 [Bacillus sp. AFS002410]|uniref:VanZ family protein n=1 Tax=Bacillus sp. AFS002410 TaxID=2033481 RepID=UPI000BF1A14E|nr:VanZ family protein [Bacillus sp. AFS002410]PEJ60842.1 hypothetical protein CN692_01775 [Bacillus sp. AFS002410]